MTREFLITREFLQFEAKARSVLDSRVKATNRESRWLLG